MPPQTTVLPQPRNGSATTALVLGLVSLVAWIIPLIGFPVQIVGIIFGVRGIKSEHKTRAIIGIVLCSIGLLASVASAFLGANILQSQSQRDENYQFAQDTLKAMHEVEEGKNIFDSLVAERSVEKFSSGIPTISAHLQTAHSYVDPWVTGNRADIRQYAITFSNGLNNLDKTYQAMQVEMAKSSPSPAAIQTIAAANLAAQHELFNTLSQILVGLSMTKEQRDSLADDVQELEELAN